MPISAQEAMDNVFSLELKGDEIKWFDNLCLFTDYHIKKDFNGTYVNISFDSMFIPNQKGSGSINCSQYPYSMPQWRQTIVIKVWKNTYNKIGWNITDDKYSSVYKFEPNLRQMKLERILEE